MKQKYDVYDMWFSDHAGRRVMELWETAKDLGGTRAFYESDMMPSWKRNIGTYEKSYEKINKSDIKVCSLWDGDYPELLKEIYDPPFLLYYKGKLPEKMTRICGIVGSRKATSYGKRLAYDFGKILGEHEVWVISGMALGADSCAHKGCIDGGGLTAAVLGSGADVCTPSSNRKLYEEIIESGGCVLSEFLPGTPGYASNYPKRNRIISGMSENIIVTEADEKSGTSVTAGMALEQGREVFALPGNITSVMSRGTNRLIKEGATPLISVEDILWEMGIYDEHRKNKMPELSEAELKVLRIIEKKGEICIDELQILYGKSSSELYGIVTVLEIKGVILKNNGKIIIAK
ncbi:MAG: DNA-protecting protein DprA [Clostridiales bacterium]|nr:DNA-protecting protein DprA [Clostridiales bacterium]